MDEVGRRDSGINLVTSILVDGLIYILLAEKFPQIKLWHQQFLQSPSRDLPSRAFRVDRGDRI